MSRTSPRRCRALTEALSTKRRVAELLVREGGKLVSSTLLASELGLSRQAIWKAVQSLREEGFPLESLPHRGYRFLPEERDVLSPMWFACMTRDLSWGKPAFAFPSVESTQTIAKELARQGAPEGTIVLAEKQTAGRGRRGRNWFSPPQGGIYISILLRPPLPPSRIQLLSFAAGLGVLHAVFSLCGARCELKWPNDLLFEERKLCGILSEAAGDPERIAFAVVGIGINVSIPVETLPEELREKIVSLKEISHEPVPRGTLVVELLRAFSKTVRSLIEEGPERLLEEYAAHCATIGRTVRVETDGATTTGVAVAVSPEGALVVDTPEGRRSFASADVVHVRGGNASEGKGGSSCG